MTDTVMRNNKELMQFIGRFKGMQQDHLRSLVLSKNIQDIGDFVWLTKRELEGKGCGGKFFSEFKKSLLEMGYQYDADSSEDLDKKMKKMARCGAGDGLLRLRFKILDRDGFGCQYCGRSPRTNPEVELNVDHIHPSAKNGTWEEGNLITSCRDCNAGKGDIILQTRIVNG